MNRNHLPRILFVTLVAAFLPAADINAAASHTLPEKKQPVWDCTGRTPHVKHAQYNDIRYLAEIAPPAQDVSDAEPYESLLFALAQKTDDAAISTYLTDEFRPCDANVQLEQAEQIQLLTTPVETKNFNTLRDRIAIGNSSYRERTPLTWLEKALDDKDYVKIWLFLNNPRLAHTVHTYSAPHWCSYYDKRFCADMVSLLHTDCSFILNSRENWAPDRPLKDAPLLGAIVEQLLRMGEGDTLKAHEQLAYAHSCDTLDFAAKRAQLSGIMHPNTRIRNRNQEHSRQAYRQLHAAIDEENNETVTQLLATEAFTNRLAPGDIIGVLKACCVHPDLMPCLLTSSFFANLPLIHCGCTLLDHAIMNNHPTTVRAFLADPVNFPNAAINTTPHILHHVAQQIDVYERPEWGFFAQPGERQRRCDVLYAFLDSERVPLEQRNKDGNIILHTLIWISLIRTRNITAIQQALRASLTHTRFPTESGFIDTPNNAGIRPLHMMAIFDRREATDDRYPTLAAILLGMRLIQSEERTDEHPEFEGRDWTIDTTVTRGADPNAGLTKRICRDHLGRPNPHYYCEGCKAVAQEETNRKK